MTHESAIDPDHAYSPLAQGADLERDAYPTFGTLSGAWIYSRLPLPLIPQPVELAHVRLDRLGVSKAPGGLVAAYGFLSAWIMA